MTALEPLYVNTKRKAFLWNRLEQKDRPLHVVGIGRFGGNLALIKWLAHRGNSIIVWERHPISKFSAALKTIPLNSKKVLFHWSAEPQLPDDDLIFVTPAVAPNESFISHLDPAQISTEIELSMCLMSQLNTQVHVITGSVGKSTCCCLLAKLIGTTVYGNIGRSILGETQAWPSKLVLELSSFQLHYLSFLEWKPSSIVMTPLGEHHKKWHGGLEEYLKIKEQAFWSNAKQRPRSRFDDKLTPLPLDITLNIPGQHNHNNARLVHHHGLKLQQKLNLGDMARFSGLPHRLESVHQNTELNCINDSKATSPDALKKALLSIEGPLIVIIMGVYTSNWQAPLKIIKEKNAVLHVVGNLSDHLGDLPDISPKLHPDLSACIKSLPRELKGTLLFSPGGPSYDQYMNYEERGEHFSSLCRLHFL